jgi:hypothetical protein
MDGLLERVVRESGVPDLLEALAERLAPTDLQSLLLEVYRRRAGRQTPAGLLDRYAQDRFVRPSPASPLVAAEFDRLAFSLAAPPFAPIELAPVCPLGTNSALASVDQNWTVATIRNTELTSDSTTVLALECALRRRALLRQTPGTIEHVRLCASHRLLRAQRYDQPDALAHFRLFALCTAGRDEGAHRFEIESLAEHLGFYVRLLSSWAASGRALREVRVTVTALDQSIRQETVQAQVLDPLCAAFADVQAEFDPHRQAGRGYYTGLCFHIYAKDGDGKERFLVDGGLTTWTQTLLSDRKERLMTSGIGSERVCSVFAATR